MSTLSVARAHPLLVPPLKQVEIVVVDTVRAMIHRTALPERTHYLPPRSHLLEDAAMAREMRHL